LFYPKRLPFSLNIIFLEFCFLNGIQMKQEPHCQRDLVSFGFQNPAVKDFEKNHGRVHSGCTGIRRQGIKEGQWFVHVCELDTAILGLTVKVRNKGYRKKSFCAWVSKE
jgi:hypothetical protein